VARAGAGLADLQLHTGDGHEALKASDAHWDVIILSGAVVTEPADFLARLNAGGGGLMRRGGPGPDRTALFHLECHSCGHPAGVGRAGASGIVAITRPMIAAWQNAG